MWRFARQLIIFIFVIIAALIIATPNVLALQNTPLGKVVMRFYSPTKDISITWTPAFGVMPITNFQVNKIDDQLVCVWTNSPTGTATMIRAKYNSVPTGLTDGYLVYYGPAETAIDSGVSDADMLSSIYYIAIAETPDGWSTPVQATYEGIMDLIILIIVVAIIVIFAYWRRIPILKAVGGIVVILFGVYWITSNTPEMNNFLYLLSGGAYCIGGIVIVLTAWEKH